MLDLIFKRLSEDAGITAIVGSRIYPYIRDEQTDTPAIMFEITSTEFLDTMSSTSKADTSSISITSISKRAIEANQLQQLIRSNLDGLSGSIEVSDDVTYHVSSCRLTAMDMNARLNGRLYAGEMDFDIHSLQDATSPVSGNLNISNYKLSAEDAATLDHFRYDPIQDQLIADRAIETTLNSLFLGEQHKMSSGAENIFFTNLGTDINFYPMWGGLKDQSLAANQGPSGFIPPSGRVYTDMFSIPLGGDPDPLNSLPYSGPNYFGVNIAGLGITTVAAEQVPATQHLEYRLSVNGKQVYLQKLKKEEVIYVGNQIEWFFDHPVEIHAGTTIFAEIRKVVTADDTDMGQFMVQRGQTANDDGTYRYQAIVHNRLFEDKDLELISPYLKYKAMDFGIDATGHTVTFKDLSLGAESSLISHAANTIEAIAIGTEIQIKAKNGAKILIESLPVSAATIDGVYVNSVLNLALIQLNDLFEATATSGTPSPHTGNPVNDFALNGTDLTITLTDGTSFTVDVTTLTVDENNFVSSGSLNGTNLELTMDNASTVVVDASGLAVDTDTVVTSGTISGTDLILTLNDSTTITIDASTLGGGGSSGNPVVSGSVVGTDLILILDDATTVTVDVTNMINGSTLNAGLNSWYISYGTYADEAVWNAGTNFIKNGVNLNTQGPYYWGQDLARGQEYRWNGSTAQQMRIGIWDGPELATAYNQGQIDNAKWHTCFQFLNGGTRWTNATNTNVADYQGGTNQYAIQNNDALAIRFKMDGHLELWDYSGATDVMIGKTVIALAQTSFKLQMGCWTGGQFPNGTIVTSTDLNWEIAHDFNGDDTELLDGLQDHTVIQSKIGIEAGEKWMFMMDMFGANQYLGLEYSDTVSNNANAEVDIEWKFKYDSAEGFQNFVNWTLNAGNQYNVNSTLWRPLNGTPVGMMSIRYQADYTIELWHENGGDGELVATLNSAWDGTTIFPVMGFSGTNLWTNVPTISKQFIVQGAQPDTNYAPIVSNHVFSVDESSSVNSPLVATGYIVNQWVETDAPSWLSLDQSTGVFSGTAPAHTGTAADAVVVNCRAGNAVGGVTFFTVTFNVVGSSYTNTKSLYWPVNGTANLNGPSNSMQIMKRTGNGSGASDAWSMSMWVKPSSVVSSQSLFLYGGDDEANKGTIQLLSIAGNISLQYGSDNNGLFLTGVNNFPHSQWNHVLVTYDGGTTGVASTDVADYFSRFKIFVNGSQITTTNQHQNYGLSGNVPSERYRIGKGVTSGVNMASGMTLNQFAIWDSDQSASASGLYNGGATQDLKTGVAPVGTMAAGYVAPSHYYEFGTSVSTISDINGSVNFAALNFPSSSLVNDAP